MTRRCSPNASCKHWNHSTETMDAEEVPQPIQQEQEQYVASLYRTNSRQLQLLAELLHPLLCCHASRLCRYVFCSGTSCQVFQSKNTTRMESADSEMSLWLELLAKGDLQAERKVSENARSYKGLRGRKKTQDSKDADEKGAYLEPRTKGAYDRV